MATKQLKVDELDELVNKMKLALDDLAIYEDLEDTLHNVLFLFLCEKGFIKGG